MEEKQEKKKVKITKRSSYVIKKADKLSEAMRKNLARRKEAQKIMKESQDN